MFTADAPVIGISGISGDSRSVQAMMACVSEAGAIPILLANHERRNAAEDIEKLDAVIVMGNDFDVEPQLYIHRYPEGDPRRDVHPKTNSATKNTAAFARSTYEQYLIREALKCGMPLFTICGGMQLANVLQGGTLHQHIPDLIGHERHAKNDGKDAAVANVQVKIVPGTLLDRIIKDKSLYAKGMPPLIAENGTVNAFHHQAVHLLGKDFIACAHSDHYLHDGADAHLIEAIEPDMNGAFKDQFFLGVQWHPEFLPEATDRIVRDMKEAARAWAKAQKRTHPKQEAKIQNVLSAVPFLKSIQEYTQGNPNKPKGRGR